MSKSCRPIIRVQVVDNALSETEIVASVLVDKDNEFIIDTDISNELAHNTSSNMVDLVIFNIPYRMFYDISNSLTLSYSVNLQAQRSVSADDNSLIFDILLETTSLQKSIAIDNDLQIDNLVALTANMAARLLRENSISLDEKMLASALKGVFTKSRIVIDSTLGVAENKLANLSKEERLVMSSTDGLKLTNGEQLGELTAVWMTIGCNEQVPSQLYRKTLLSEIDGRSMVGIDDGLLLYTDLITI